MKRVVVWFLGAALLVGYGCTPKVDTAAETARVKTVVDQFEQVWETEDMDLLSRIMAHDADMVSFGTDAAEHFVGWEGLQTAVAEMFPSFDQTEFTVSEQVIRVHPSGEVAWVSELVAWDGLAGGEEVHVKGIRLTGVLEKRNGNWVFVQFHASVPVAEQAMEY